MQDQDVLYYDGSCPLCRREMKHLRKLKSEGLLLQDIHELSTDPLPSHRDDHPDKAVLLRSLHLRRGDDWVTGLDANIAAWQHTRIGVLWRWLSFPMIKPIANWCYQTWASRRFAKRYPSEHVDPAKL